MMKDKALFLYGFDVTQDTQNINFKNQSGGPELTAVLTIGNYTATEYLAEVKRAMEVADGVYKYTPSLNRTVNSNTQNRTTITTTAPYFDVLFDTGTNAANSARSLLGWDAIDYTGSLSYTGSNSAGVILIPDFPTYDYLGPDDYVTNDGVKNVSASGIKETLVFAQMQFFQGQWKYITDFQTNTQLTQWRLFMKYAIRQKKFEFSPSIYENPNTFYQCTLESTPADSNGLAYKLNQMRGEGLYRFFDTGVIKFRVKPS